MAIRTAWTWIPLVILAVCLTLLNVRQERNLELLRRRKSNERLKTIHGRTSPTADEPHGSSRDDLFQDTLKKVPVESNKGLQACLDTRKRFANDPHLATSTLPGVGEVLVFDPHSQVPREHWVNGKRPPGLTARYKRRYLRSDIVRLMLSLGITHFLVNHGQTGGIMWKQWSILAYSNCNPRFIDGRGAITLFTLPDTIIEWKDRAVDEFPNSLMERM